MELLKDISIEPIVSSQYMKPYRMNYSLVKYLLLAYTLIFMTIFYFLISSNWSEEVMGFWNKGPFINHVAIFWVIFGPPPPPPNVDTFTPMT